VDHRIINLSCGWDLLWCSIDGDGDGEPGRHSIDRRAPSTTRDRLDCYNSTGDKHGPREDCSIVDTPSRVYSSRSTPRTSKKGLWNGPSTDRFEPLLAGARMTCDDDDDDDDAPRSTMTSLCRRIAFVIPGPIQLVRFAPAYPSQPFFRHGRHLLLLIKTYESI
jgi:hypothetical protein